MSPWILCGVLLLLGAAPTDHGSEASASGPIYEKYDGRRGLDPEETARIRKSLEQIDGGEDVSAEDAESAFLELFSTDPKSVPPVPQPNPAATAPGEKQAEASKATASAEGGSEAKEADSDESNAAKRQSGRATPYNK